MSAHSHSSSYSPPSCSSDPSPEVSLDDQLAEYLYSIRWTRWKLSRTDKSVDHEVRYTYGRGGRKDRVKGKGRGKLNAVITSKAGRVKEEPRLGKDWTSWVVLRGRACLPENLRRKRAIDLTMFSDGPEWRKYVLAKHAQEDAAIERPKDGLRRNGEVLESV